VHREEQGHIAFLLQADLVIHDAQYTAAEYPQKVGWGHSTVEYAVDVALAAQVKRLVLFHHDPLRDDAAVERLADLGRQHVVARGGTLEVFAAAEGQVIELPEVGQNAALPMAYTATGVEVSRTANATVTILIVDDDPDIVRLLQVTLRPEGFRLLAAYDGETALQMARTERPSLLLMDWQMPGRNGLEVCRALRVESDLQLRDMPVVLLTAQTMDEHVEAGFAAGVTDYVTKPFYPAYVRSRIREWLLRKRVETSEGA
jgi:CheY-like chemotaxis protein